MNIPSTSLVPKMLAATVLACLVGSSFGSPSFSPWNSEELFKRAVTSSGCSATGTASCTNTSSVSNLCCFQAPGGLLLQTQFWDTDPSTGPSNSWTIHGLWPDHCDGTFDESCDSSRAYTGISTLLTNQGASDTLDFMNTYWKDINGKDETFWEHEWSTVSRYDLSNYSPALICVLSAWNLYEVCGLLTLFTVGLRTASSTLETKCLPSGSPKGAEAVAFFNTVVRLFKTLPTYQWLADAGITPSSSTTHTLASLTAALKSGYGFTPALDCDGSAVSQISYYYHLQGSVIDGTFVPINAPEAGSCSSSGIKYLPKTGSPVTTTSTTTKSTTSTKTTSTATGAPTAIPTKATIQAIQNGNQVGGLLSLGTWSTQTLATYTLSGSATSLKLSTSKGTCGVSDGVFDCGNGDSTTFSAVTSGSLLLLAYQGDTSFSSDDVPSGSTVYPVNAGSDDDEITPRANLRVMSPPSDHPCLHLHVLQEPFFVRKLEPGRNQLNEILKDLEKDGSSFFSITRTDEELSVVGQYREGMPDAYREVSGWRAFKIAGPMEFNLTGVLAGFVEPLKRAEVPIFAVSTWNTDYILVPKEKLDISIEGAQGRWVDFRKEGLRKQ
ncbi:RNase Gf29 [Mycena sanguinolenta]|uniref:Ribonuclease T2-like n=1 Tax=Mycena sanguinolenta TaxID=230812 RepID=A0A8H6XB56_9AGAR|nr:RNase Gf29 [Mycena sanguinolenta]